VQEPCRTPTRLLQQIAHELRSLSGVVAPGRRLSLVKRRWPQHQESAEGVVKTLALAASIRTRRDLHEVIAGSRAGRATQNPMTPAVARNSRPGSQAARSCGLPFDERDQRRTQVYRPSTKASKLHQSPSTPREQPEGAAADVGGACRDLATVHPSGGAVQGAACRGAFLCRNRVEFRHGSCTRRHLS
jgi:hypothetical protein